MVTILKPGKPKDEETFVGVCRGCQCHFQYMRKEAQLVPDQRDGDYLEIACPECGQSHTQALRE